MKLLLATLILQAAAVLSFGGLPTPIQTQTNGLQGGSQTTLAATFGSGVTGGDLTIAVISLGGTYISTPSISSVSDDQGDAFTIIDKETGHGFCGALAYCLNTTAGAKKITASISQPAGDAQSIAIAEYPLTGRSLDQHTSALQTNVNSLASGSTGSTAQANELAIGWATTMCARTADSYGLSSPSPSSDLTQIQTPNVGCVAGFSDVLLSATGSQSSSYTFNGSMINQSTACGIATFEVPAALPTTSPRPLWSRAAPALAQQNLKRTIAGITYLQVR